MAKKVGKEEEELMVAIKEREALIEEARKKLADRIPFWEKQRDEAQEKLAEANKMLALLRGVPAKAPAARRAGGGTREEFMKWFEALDSGTTVTLKEMSEQTGIPRGTVWAIKEAIMEEGLIAEVGRGVYKKV